LIYNIISYFPKDYSGEYAAFEITINPDGSVGTNVDDDDDDDREGYDNNENKLKCN